jgi:hypothetical protein
MRGLGFTPEEFRLIARACERVLVNPNLMEVDLKPFLVARLVGTAPELAARVAGLDNSQLAALREEVCIAFQAPAESALWKPQPRGRLTGSAAAQAVPGTESRGRRPRHALTAGRHVILAMFLPAGSAGVG